MQDQPIGGPAAATATAPSEDDRDVQRAVLLAMLTTPSDGGEPVAAIAAAISQPPAAVREAVDLLIWIGLLNRSGCAVRAAAAALHVAELWPVPR
jgi:hypothetical protein